jgi:hypothetical protein
MKKSTKSILAVVLVVLLAIAAFFCWRAFAPGAQAGSKTLSVAVTHADGSEKDFTLRTDADYLWDAMYEQGLIDGTDSEYGKWVTTVDGETADESAGQYWMFTRSGEWVDTACDKTPITDGESYEFFVYIS